MNKPSMHSAWPGLMPQYTREELLDGCQAILDRHNAAHKPQQRAQLLNPNWKYTPANKTDVRATWARFGWKPTSK